MNEASNPASPMHAYDEAISNTACAECGASSVDVYQDPSDSRLYCESYWIDYYGAPPRDHRLPKKLVSTALSKTWRSDVLEGTWAADPISSWPVCPPVACKALP